MTVLVHTMAKVGSVSMQRLLTKAGVNAIHVHYITKPDGEYTISGQLKWGVKVAKRDQPWRIVTLIRKPIQRNISAFFHSLGRYYTNDYYDYEALRNSFIHNYKHDWPQIWIEEEFNVTYDVDLLNMPFDPNRGYAIYEVRDDLEILLVRTEDLTTVGRQAINKFFQMDWEILEVETANFGKKPWYAPFRRELSIPQELVDRLNNLPYAKHFYTEEELTEKTYAEAPVLESW